MTKLGLLVTLEAKAGKEAQLANFLTGALPLVEAEPETTAWFAIRMGPSTFGIFDAFADERGRGAHLSGEVAKAADSWRSRPLKRNDAAHRNGMMPPAYYEMMPPTITR